MELYLNDFLFFEKFKFQYLKFWSNLYSINSETNEFDIYKNIYGATTVNHKLYRPRLYNMDDFVDTVFVDTTNRYIDNNVNSTNFSKSISVVIQEKFNSFPNREIYYDQFISIDKNGFIVPLKKWIIDYTWKIYENEINERKIYVKNIEK